MEECNVPQKLDRALRREKAQVMGEIDEDDDFGNFDDF